MKPWGGRARAAPVALLLLVLAILAALPLAAPAAAAMLDNRGWEMVSPVQKNGGDVAPPGGPAAALAGLGVFRAAAAGGSIAYASPASFGEAAGAAPISQYVAARGTTVWTTQNVTPPLLSGTYEGDPYLAFSANLERALLTNGWSCRGGAAECEAENPPLSPQAPPGYRNLYLREGAAYTPLITRTNFALPPEPKDFHLALEGASPDLLHVVISTGSQLYEWSGGTLRPVGSPGQVLAAPAAAVSEDGSRVYSFALEDGPYYLDEGGAAKPIPGTAGGAASFGGATADGSRAFFIEGGDLLRYDASTEQLSQPLATGVQHIAAISPDGSHLYYVAADGLYLFHAGVATKIANAAPASLPPASGPATVADAGARLFFTSAARLLTTDTDGRPDAYEWEAQGTGSCTTAPGCLALLSSGRSGEATFVDASGSGDDAYFTTDASLLGIDPGAVDLYDARVNGGFPEPPTPIPCTGDACQGPAPGPEDPTPGTATFEGPVNPPLRFAKPHHRKKRHHHSRRHHHRRHHRSHRRRA